MAWPIWATEIALLLLAPVLAVVLFDISLINQDGATDPWFYMAYGRIFPLMHALYGWTYYSVRFPVLILNGVFLRFPDPIVGYIALRYFLLLLCGIPLYLWARHFFGIAIAIASYLLLFCNPLFPRVVLWDLTTFVSIPFALSGMALWLLPMRSLALNRILTGFLFCASIGAHAFTGTAIGIFLIIEALRRLIHKDLRNLFLYDILATGFGGLLCVGIGILYYYFEIGSFDPMEIITVTTGAARAVSQSGVGLSTSRLAWLGTQYHVYVPYLLILVAAGCRGRKLVSDEIAARVWTFSAVYGGAYAIYQFTLGNPVLQTYWYFGHLTLVVYLLFPVCLFLILRSTPPRQQPWIAAIAALTLIALPALIHFAPPLTRAVETATLDSRPAFLDSGVPGSLVAAGIVAMCILCAGLARVATRRPTFALAAVALLVTMMQLAPIISWEHRRIFNNPSKAREFGIYRAALDMLDVFSAYAQPTAKVMLWYPGSELSIRSIASTVLVFTLHDPWKGRGMPSFGDYERRRLLLQPGLRYIMLMSQKPGAVTEGLEALIHEGLIIREVTRRTIGAKGFSADLILIEIEDPILIKIEEILARAVSVDLDRMVPASANSLQHEGGRLIGRSLPRPWAYIGKLDLGADCVASGGWVSVELRGKNGQIGIGVLNRKGDDFLVRRWIAPGESFQSVHLPVESFREAGGLVVQNGERGVSSEAEIRSVKRTNDDPDAPTFCAAAPTPGPTEEMLARAISVPLDRMVPDFGSSLQHEGGRLIGRSLPRPWAYIGKLDLGADCVASGGWVSVELRGKNGQIGVGVLNRKGDDFLVRRWIAPGESFQSVHLPVESFHEAGGLIVQNGETGVSSEGEIRSVKRTNNDPDAPAC